MPSPCGRRGRHLLRPWPGDEILVAHRHVGDGQFEYPVKHHATTAGAAAVEAEHELVEIADQMSVVDGVLVGAQEPTLGQ